MPAGSSADLVGAFQAEMRRRQEAQAARSQGHETGLVPSRDMQATRDPVQAGQNEDRFVLAQALGELQRAKLLRAVYSERPLEEVVVDFWFNHFNVDARKQSVIAMVGHLENALIRPHVFGKFRDLLGATARNGAMLIYLDKAPSSVEMEPTMRVRMREEMRRPARGLNKNYARERMELHTSGVDGRYSQKDVVEVAQAFTGWTVERRTGDFVFRARLHDEQPKKVLGQWIRGGGGMKDGEQVLDRLAAHPATAQHIAKKLCQRFVADEPPSDLVERIASAFLRSEGDLRKTYEAVFFDPEFFHSTHQDAKIKSPFEFVVSALRATGVDLKSEA
jgi:uncharacterized protein (DUF1800 family)